MSNVCMYVCRNVLCMFIFTVGTYVCICMCMYVRMYACLHACTHASVVVCVCVCVNNVDVLMQ